MKEKTANTYKPSSLKAFIDLKEIEAQIQQFVRPEISTISVGDFILVQRGSRIMDGIPARMKWIPTYIIETRQVSKVGHDRVVLDDGTIEPKFRIKGVYTMEGIKRYTGFDFGKVYEDDMERCISLRSLYVYDAKKRRIK